MNRISSVLAASLAVACLAAGQTKSFAAEWVSTANYELKVVVVVVREAHVQEALRQFIGEKTCTGVSDWIYELYLEREDKGQPGNWVTDAKPHKTGFVKLCKGP